MQLVHERAARARHLEHVGAAVARIVGAGDEALVLQAVDQVRDGGQRDPEGLAHVAHAAGGVRGHVEEHLALRIAEVELGGTLPEKLSEDRAAEGVEEIEELLGLRRPAPVPSSVSLRGHSVMVHSLNS